VRQYILPGNNEPQICKPVAHYMAWQCRSKQRPANLVQQVSPQCALMLAILALVTAASCQQPVKTADASCARCHAEICRKYQATPMANGSGVAGDHFLAGEFTHLPSEMRYKIFRDQGKVWLSFADEQDARISGQRQLDYFLGSGHLGTTYLYTQDGYLLESPVAWYAAINGYDMKPGFNQLTEMPPALPMEPGCLRCHMTGVAHTIHGSLSRYAGLPFTQSGIACESCHGDASAHVRTGGKAAVVNPATLSAERRDSICISCHLEGDASVERAGRSALDYRPGDRISDYLSFFVFKSKDALSRGVSEVEQFNASRCKLASGDSMSCTSCHDPHGYPTPTERPQYYRSKCLACHNSPTFMSTHHPETQDCTSCHMPRSKAQNIPHVAWTDHRILRRPDSATLSPLDPRENGPLVAIFSPQANERDAAIGMYETLVRGKSSNRAEAIAKLKQVDATGAGDERVIEALGVLSGLAGNLAASETWLQKLVAADPSNLTGTADLGVLFARQGKVKEAVELWKPVFDKNKDMVGLARNLAVGQCTIGDSQGAMKTIADARKFSPGVRELLKFTCADSGPRQIPAK
jgi:hypothetical protein